MKRLLASLVLILPVLTVGCGAENPNDIPAVLPDGGPDEPIETGHVEFSVDEALTSTPWFSVVVRGTGPSGGTLRYTGGAEGLQTYPIDSSGSYCIDIKLRDGENNLKFDAIDADGIYSDQSLFHSVTRQGALPEPDPDPVNDGGTADRTAGSTYAFNADGAELDGLVVEDGAFADLVNGNTADFVQFYGTGANNEFIVFELPEPMKVTGFEVSAPPTNGDGCGPEGFDMYIIDEVSPAHDSPMWIKAATVVKSGATPPAINHEAGGGTYELPAYPRSVWATHFGIKMSNASCGVLDRVYGLSEVRVFAELEGDNAPPVSEPGPSCQSGGI